MKHKPEDLDIVEWHYLIMYFGSEKFKKVSSQNSSNRKQMRTTHVMGSKPFSQCSWEQRDPETGVELGLLALWKTTHTKQGKWSNEISKDIYINTARKLSVPEADERIEGETESITSSSTDEDLVFQSTYKETTGSKSTKRCGVGYMSKYPSKSNLLQERLEEQEREVEKLKGQLAKEAAEKEAAREELKRSIREELKKEFLSTMAGNRGVESPQEDANVTNNTVEDEVRDTEDNNDESPHNDEIPLHRDETAPQINNVADGETSVLHHDGNEETLLQPTETLQQPRCVITTQKEDMVPSTCNSKTKVMKNLFSPNSTNRYISPQTLLTSARTRLRKRKEQDSQALGL